MSFLNFLKHKITFVLIFTYCILMVVTNESFAAEKQNVSKSNKLYNKSKSIPYYQIIECQKNNPILNKLIYDVRDPKTNMRDFRSSLQKIGEYMGLEIAKELDTKNVKIKTIMQTEAKHTILNEAPVFMTILRAANPLQYGLQKVFPDAENGFLALTRNEETLLPTSHYSSLPKVEGKTVIIVDVMIATGGSIVETIKTVEKQNPKAIIVAGVISAKPGLEKILRHNNKVKIYTAAIDPLLNDVGYIVPGLGDAGDRAYGRPTRKH